MPYTLILALLLSLYHPKQPHITCRVNGDACTHIEVQR